MLRKIARRAALVLLAGVCFFVAPQASHAACSNPAGVEGNAIFNTTTRQFQYCDNANWIAMHPPPASSAPTGCPSIGDVCADGSVYAGLSPDGNVAMYTTPADAGGVPWNNGNTSAYTTTGQTSTTTGEANTTALIGLDSDSGVAGTQPHQAAQACADSTANGQSDWYLPAKDELNVLYTNKAAIGGFNTAGSWYWSSTEETAADTWSQRFSDGVQNGGSKTNGRQVRCVRKLSGNCANPSRPEGALNYNPAYRVVQGCAGGRWMALGPVGGTGPVGTSGLVGHWALDETGGTTATDSAGDNDGTLTNMEPGTDWTSGNIGNALDLDGVDEYVAFGNPAVLNLQNALTLSVWIRPDVTHFGGIVERANNTELTYALNLLSTDKIGFQINWNGTNPLSCFTPNGSIPIGVWSLITATYDKTLPGQNMKVFVNGNLSATCDHTAGINNPGGVTVQIGVNLQGGDEYFNGLIDDPRIYDRALGNSEIQALYLQTGVCANPAGSEGAMIYNSTIEAMQYCDGANWVAIGKSGEAAPDPCAGSPSPGDVCADGTVYAGLSPDGNVAMYTTPADTSSGTPWNNGNTTGYVTTSQNSTITGQANTTALIAIDSNSNASGTQPHQAAQACADLSAYGQSDWYLPARDELNILYTNKTAIGGFNISGRYYSSTESASTYAIFLRFTDGVQGFTNKSITNSVRCVRR